MADLMALRRRILMGYDPDLPPGYRRVEYLESSGTQYIDTLVSGGTSATYPAYILDFMPLDSTQNYQQYLCGVEQPVSIPKVYREGRTRPLALYSGAGFYPTNAQNVYSFGTRYIVSTSEAGITINGASISFPAVSGGGWGSMTWYIFSSHKETTYKSNMRLYGLKMYTDGILIRDYIPCVRGSDNKPGLYDTVTNSFFVNQGTGEFITG